MTEYYADAETNTIEETIPISETPSRIYVRKIGYVSKEKISDGAGFRSTYYDSCKKFLIGRATAKLEEAKIELEKVKRLRRDT